MGYVIQETKILPIPNLCKGLLAQHDGICMCFEFAQHWCPKTLGVMGEGAEREPMGAWDLTHSAIVSNPGKRVRNSTINCEPYCYMSLAAAVQSLASSSLWPHDAHFTSLEVLIVMCRLGCPSQWE